MQMTITKLMVLITFILFVVYIDPAEAVICPSIADVYIDQYAPDENMNYKTRILISYHPSKGIARGLFKFDIPDEIDSSEIISATLYLSGSYHTGGGDAINVRCYALNEPFSEGSDTWTSLGGGNYDSSVSSPGSLPAGSDWETSFDVTELAAGNLDMLRDYGMLIKLQNESVDNYQNIASREFVDPQDFAPYLDIAYTESTTSSTSTEPVSSSTTSIPISSTTSSFVSTSSTTSIIADTTTIITSSTTTTRKPPCLIEAIYGEDSEEVVLMKYVRDTILRSTPEGREIVQVYYAWSPFIVTMIGNEPALQDELKEILDVFLDTINASIK